MILLLLVCGCSNENRPKDLPKLYPVILNILLDDQPLNDALVTLYTENRDIAKWSVGSVTDADGKAIIMTHGQFHGAPAGKFKVCVKKTKVEGEEESKPKEPQTGFVVDLSQSQQPMGMPKMINYVDPLFGNPESTTLEIEVPESKKMTTLTLNVHKPQ